MRICVALFLSAFVLTLRTVSVIAAESGISTAPVLKALPGFSVELVAGPPLTERPITASFDEEGRLYVAESSGSNDPVQKQLAELPHRIVRLEDTDGDGRFDRRTVFADRMMFPEGTLFFDGSLYVSAPPSIWKLTDTNGDGVADERSEWFQGKTLTGCANDLHGPYLGPDGWIYWCKGAFAKQTHQVNGREWSTEAAHIFRCRPDGSGFEPVMTGGMDNPVDVVTTPEGERILSATYYVGGGGRRDGLAHVIYGGVYGKEHGVLDGHPRTGELMPAFALMSPAAPCGLERYESDVFGAEFRDNLFMCQFNLRKVSRHALRPAGSSFASEDSDFVTSEHVDFHPTDVLMDADGSLLIVDTGGWYKLCCPTSQLWKPDVLGGIYRVRRDDAARPADPRGRQIDWSFASIEQLWALLADARPAVRHRATHEFVHRAETEAMQKCVDELTERGIAVALLCKAADSPHASSACDQATAALARTWALSQIASPAARKLMRELLRHTDERVQHVAVLAASLYRDADAIGPLVELLGHHSPAIRRAAAEALGRIGNTTAVPPLLAAAATVEDRILQHSITFALIELNDPAATQAGLASDSLRSVATALMALDQMPSGNVVPAQVIPLLNADNDHLRDTARWIVTQHPDWGGDLAEWFGEQLSAVTGEHEVTAEPTPNRSVLESMLMSFASHVRIQSLLADTIRSGDASPAARAMALRVVTQARLNPAPQELRTSLAKAVSEAQPDLLPLAVAAARVLPPATMPDELDEALLELADSTQFAQDLRVSALAAETGGLPDLQDSRFELLLAALASENPVALRSAAADGISRARLTTTQLEKLCNAVEQVGPLELARLLVPYKHATDESLGLRLLDALRNSSALRSVRVDLLRESLVGYGPNVGRQIDALELLVNSSAADQRKKIEELLPLMSQGDIRRGHAVYYSPKATCSACHRLGHAGGTIGPELTKIGDSRTERDLLESILFPSLSFVRSFEPVLIVTVDGKTLNGTIRSESAEEYILTTGADQEARVRRDEIEEMQPSTVSIMPAGLDGQLSSQELADLVAFLKNAKSR